MSRLLPYFVARESARQMDREGRNSRVFNLIYRVFVEIPLALVVIGAACWLLIVLGIVVWTMLFGS